MSQYGRHVLLKSGEGGGDLVVTGVPLFCGAALATAAKTANFILLD